MLIIAIHFAIMMKQFFRNNIYRSVLLSLVFLFVGANCLADNNPAENTQDEQVEKLDAGALIIDHLLDSYEWHIFTWKDKHVSVPLTIIVYTDGHLYSFSSKHFHHEPTYTIVNKSGEEVTFTIAGEESSHKGKVVRLMDDGTEVVPIDISITKNVMGLFISCATLLIIFFFVVRGYKKRGEGAPKGIQALIEPVYIFVRDEIAKNSIGEKKYERYLPYLVTVFFFILISNLLGLIPFFPFGANLTGNIGVTAVLALFTFVITNFMGTKHYYKDIFNTPGVPWWLKVPMPLMPLIEVVGVFTKPFVLAVRLFANITAGHIVILGFVSLIFVLGEISVAAGGAMSVLSLVLAVFVDCLELLVAFIQAYVFTLLSAIYFGMASKSEE